LIPPTPHKNHPTRSKKERSPNILRGVATEMSLRNVRRTHDVYDPKQRFVGGIVLILLILFIYSILKLMLGLSAPQGGFTLNDPTVLERYPVAKIDDNNSLLVESTRNTTDNTSNLPAGFVFLDLNGKVMEKEEQTSHSADQVFSLASNEAKKWYVQAASFKDQSLAQRLVRQIKENHIAEEGYVIFTRGWYVVRLPPQVEYQQALQQNRQLYALLRTKGMIKEINR
jgi:hypothetical protein